MEQPDKEEGLQIFFNPFAFDMETNNEFLAKGYEVMPISIPKDSDGVS